MSKYLEFQQLMNERKNPQTLIHKTCGCIATKGYYIDGTIDYYCKKCDVTFLNNKKQTIIS